MYDLSKIGKETTFITYNVLYIIGFILTVVKELHVNEFCFYFHQSSKVRVSQKIELTFRELFEGKIIRC